MQAVGEANRNVLVLEFEPDFERRSSFGDAGWADHAVPDLQEKQVELFEEALA